MAAARDAWAEALQAAGEHGIRNAQVTLIAPTGTVSLMLDCETTGIGPYFAFATTKHFADGGETRLTSRRITAALARLGYPTHRVDALWHHAAEHGNLAGAPGLRAGGERIFQTVTGPDPVSAEGQLRMVAAVQPLVSGGVSKTVTLAADTTAESIEAIFHDAWRMGLKSVSVYRQGSKLLQPLTSPTARPLGSSAVRGGRGGDRHR